MIVIYAACFLTSIFGFTKATPITSSDVACNNENYSFECLKLNVEQYLDNILSKDTFEVD